MKFIVVQGPAVLGHVVVASAIVCLTPSPAWAYIDPGTGSYLFQLAAAGLLAGAYTMRHYWSSLTRALRRRSNVGAGAVSPVKPSDDVE